jgi:hypothetical protein
MKQVWYVYGDPNKVSYGPNLFATKLAAEAYARECFPNESVTQRYARIYYREVIGESS